MSRSNPQAHLANPAVCWFEWNGEAGTVRYYDKDAKKNVEIALPFTFLLLDELATVRGWHEGSQSGIYSNEVRDTRQDVLIVKAFKMHSPLAEGRYQAIKDRVHTLGGAFNANCYIAFKNGGDALAIGAIRFKGSSLGAWMEFRKAHRNEIYEQAICIHGFTEGKKGRITYRMPDFKLVALGAESHKQAITLDKKLQEFLTAYLSRAKRDQVEQPPIDSEAPPPDYEGPEPPHPVDDLSDIPF